MLGGRSTLRTLPVLVPLSISSPLTARRVALLKKASENLAAYVPAVPAIKAPAPAEILDGLHPATADEIAVSRDMRDRIQVDLDRGRRPPPSLGWSPRRSPVRSPQVRGRICTAPTPRPTARSRRTRSRGSRMTCAGLRSSPPARSAGTSSTLDRSSAG